jgi:hypothetical protein
MSKKADLSALPPEIQADIRERAKAEYPDDRDWEEDFINDEANGYVAFHDTDFAEASEVRDDIIAEAIKYSESWAGRASHVQDETEAYAKIVATAPDDIPADVIAEMKRNVAAEDDWFVIQLDDLRRAIDGYRYVREIRGKVGPIRDLLIRMEAIIGQECYNGNIQNYSSWGEWEGEGRSFRYPVTFIRNGEEEKRRSNTADLAHEELVTGYYKFGANELNIYRALVRIIDMLEAEYEFQKPVAARGDKDIN